MPLSIMNINQGIHLMIDQLRTCCFYCNRPCSTLYDLEITSLMFLRGFRHFTCARMSRTPGTSAFQEFHKRFLDSEVFTEITLKSITFWNVTPFSLVEVHCRF